MVTSKWHAQRVNGRDETLRDIEKRAGGYCDTVVQDVRAVMQDYEVDMYRLVMGIGKYYGMDTAYQIMSDTVAEKRLKWLVQEIPGLDRSGTELEKGLSLYLKYFRPKEGDFLLIKQASESVVFKRKDFVNAIAHACHVLGLDVIEVNNKVYARAMNLMFSRIDLPLEHIFLNYQDGWYDERISIVRH